MKHHYGDFLDRTDDYWTTIPNRERFAFIADFEIQNKDEVKILTISKTQSQEHWEQIFECKNLEELTLHDPSKEQVIAIRKLTILKRLRITFLGTNDIEFISDLINIEELILEYVSGFTDLTPLLKLTKLKSIHFENLRRVTNFDGLKGLKSLRYLQIDGTLDFSQPIENFNFLQGIESLEVFALGFIINKTEYPALLPILKLKKLKKFIAGMSSLSTKEFAFIEVATPNTNRCNFSNTKLEKYFINKKNEAYLLGKGTRTLNLALENSTEKLKLFEDKYEEYKLEAKTIIKNYCG